MILVYSRDLLATPVVSVTQESLQYFPMIHVCITTVIERVMVLNIQPWELKHLLDQHVNRTSFLTMMPGCEEKILVINSKKIKVAPVLMPETQVERSNGIQFKDLGRFRWFIYFLSFMGLFHWRGCTQYTLNALQRYSVWFAAFLVTIHLLYTSEKEIILKIGRMQLIKWRKLPND